MGAETCGVDVRLDDRGFAADLWSLDSCRIMDIFLPNCHFDVNMCNIFNRT